MARASGSMKKYETYNKYLVRKPLFSYDILFNNDETRNIEDVVKELIQDDSFVTSIYWSSPDLYNTIISYRENRLKEDKIPRLIHTLKKYAIRASTRCTPYGTMAGVALQDFKKTHEPEPISRKARVDMDFLAEIKIHIENNENIRKKLRYKINNTLDKIPGQYRYQEPIRNADEEKYQLSSLEINEYLERISEASHFMKYDEIKNLLSDDFEDDEYFEDEGIGFDDYEDFSFDENDDDFEDNDDDFEDNDENEIDPFETVIWDYITNSAKRKFDYQSYLADFPKEIGKNIPDNILWKIIMLSSSGYDEIHISSLIMSDLIMLGFMFPKDKLIPFVIDRKKDFGLEILATQIATDALNMGSAPEAVLGQVNQLLR